MYIYIYRMGIWNDYHRCAFAVMETILTHTPLQHTVFIVCATNNKLGFGELVIETKGLIGTS